MTDPMNRDLKVSRDLTNPAYCTRRRGTSHKEHSSLPMSRGLCEKKDLPTIPQTKPVDRVTLARPLAVEIEST